MFLLLVSQIVKYLLPFGFVDRKLFLGSCLCRLQFNDTVTLLLDFLLGDKRFGALLYCGDVFA